MERLSQMIELIVEQGLWKPIQLGRGGPKLSHLVFADDLILFSEAFLDQVEVINSCLGAFCSSSREKISNEKMKVYFSRNVSWNARNQLSSELDFNCTSNLGKYLGVKLHHNRAFCFQDILVRKRNASVLRRARICLWRLD